MIPGVDLGQAVQIVMQIEGVVSVSKEDHADRTVLLQPEHHVDELITESAHVGGARSDHADGGATFRDLAIEILILHDNSWPVGFHIVRQK